MLLLTSSQNWELFQRGDFDYQAFFAPSTRVSHNSNNNNNNNDNDNDNDSTLRHLLLPSDNNNNNNNTENHVSSFQELSQQPAAVHSTNNSSKPTLFLHVGPLKTATSSIYYMLGKDKIYNTLLEKDHIQFMKDFNYKNMNKVLRDCLNVTNNQNDIVKEEDCSEWDRLVTMYRDYYYYYLSSPNNDDGSKHIIHIVHSVEIYSKFPFTNKTISILRPLADTWNVQIIVCYRRPYTWYPSAYHQYRKFYIYKSRGGRMTNFDSKRKSIQMTVAEHFEARRPYLADSLRTYELYTHVFGQDHVRVLNFNASEGVEREFLCHGLQAKHACEIAKTMKFKIVNARKFALDEDYLAITAYRQGYFTTNTTNDDNNDNDTDNTNSSNNNNNISWKSRPEIVKILKKGFFATEFNSLPKLCLSPQQKDWLWNRTLTSERILTRNFAESHHESLFSKEQDEELLLREDFEQQSSKLCTVDAQTLLQNETWQRRLRSCLFQKMADDKECNYVDY